MIMRRKTDPKFFSNIKIMIKEIIELYGDYEFLMADGFDEAIIGIDESTMRLIYSVSR
jgi:hypothetical protein